LWLNLLSLDAPLVALVWQDFLTRCFPVTLLPAGRASLGLTVWAIYLADRLLDIRRSSPQPATARHNFYREHRTAAQVLLALVCLADLGVTFLCLRPAVLDRGLVVSAGVAVYLAVFAPCGMAGPQWKKALAAVLFTLGTFLVASTEFPQHYFLWPAAAFCALCLGNLDLVEAWEHNREQARAWLWMVLLGIVSVLLVRLSEPRFFAAVAISTALLAVLARWGRLVPRDARCMLADAVLLTPLLFR
jgi:uncharacterized membrane protein HdeD (DUF308 family)